MTDPRSRAVIPVAEAHADGLTTSEEMQAAHDAARDAADEGFVTNSAYWAAMAARKLWHDWTELGEAAGHALTAQTYQELGAVWAGREPPIGSEVFAAACRTGEERTIRLIRDIYGNPFRPVTFDPSWRTSTAVGLARSMYESRDFAAMLILADALEDAGCDSPDVLAHCRDPKGVHVRGCWVVDLVLGKC